MDVYFSKTQEDAKNHVDFILKENPDFYVTEGTFDCCCGESFGYSIENEKFEEIERIIICEHCYDNSEPWKRI